MTKLYKCDKCGQITNHSIDVYFTWDNRSMSVDLCDKCNKEITTIFKKVLRKDFESLIGAGRGLYSY